MLEKFISIKNIGRFRDCCPRGDVTFRKLTLLFAENGRGKTTVLPEPDFEQRAGQWVVTLWRDWLTTEVLSRFNLNERQSMAIAYIKVHGKISNAEYQQVTHAIKKTATRDLNALKEKGLIEQKGSRGPGVHYVLARKGDIMGT
jgi:ATP-dependent DNA helicase RecG